MSCGHGNKHYKSTWVLSRSGSSEIAANGLLDEPVSDDDSGLFQLFFKYKQ